MNHSTDLPSLKGLSVLLLGMMGSGKSTVGQILARRLRYRFFDTDVLIERVTGETIAEIFARSGEERFRELETKVLEELSSQTKTVIATGGGIVLKPMNWSYLRHGLLIWLDAPIEVLVKRLEADTSRPLLRETDLESRLTLLRKQRQSLYAQADLHIPMDAFDTPEQVVDRLVARIPEVLQPSPTEREDN
jgi:shikimate kinase